MNRKDREEGRMVWAGGEKMVRIRAFSVMVLFLQEIRVF
jgi:hypothetical protein